MDKLKQNFKFYEKKTEQEFECNNIDFLKNVEFS